MVKHSEVKVCKMFMLFSKKNKDKYKYLDLFYWQLKASFYCLNHGNEFKIHKTVIL